MKYIQYIALLFIILLASCSGDGGSSTNAWFSGGIGLGGLLAVLASWSRNESILWAILHAILGWIYVIYFVITR